MPSAPVPRLDGAAVQIKNIFYVFAGYGTINYVRIFSAVLVKHLGSKFTYGLITFNSVILDHITYRYEEVIFYILGILLSNTFQVLLKF